MVDIDHFKTINDVFGHQTGDVVIQRTARVVAGRLRRGDIAVRYGGEELLILLPGAKRHAALAIAEELRGLVAKLDFSDLGPGKITISVGVAEVSGTFQDAVAAADAALYASKRAGRNRVAETAAGAAPAVVTARSMNA
jgi:diguanylate cyclase (GGDEF)-like protein